MIDRKKYMREYYQKNKDKYRKRSYNQYRNNKGVSNQKGLQIKKGLIIVDFT
tara:strand:- start:24 stop:179 length:156 start_codon:yes stop_codon:yes gene_type:complete